MQEPTKNTGRFGPGNPGKPKGAKSKATKEIKEMIHNALSNVGGEEYLTTQARENPVAFMNLIKAILPKDANVKMDVNGNVGVVLLPSKNG